MLGEVVLTVLTPNFWTIVCDWKLLRCVHGSHAYSKGFYKIHENNMKNLTLRLQFIHYFIFICHTSSYNGVLHWFHWFTTGLKVSNKCQTNYLHGITHWKEGGLESPIPPVRSRGGSSSLWLSVHWDPPSEFVPSANTNYSQTYTHTYNYPQRLQEETLQTNY